MVVGQTRPCWALVDLNAIADNYQQFKQRYPKQKVYATIKADAYGHGALAVAKSLSQIGCDGFCVACADEALELRNNGIEEAILILGVTSPTELLTILGKNIAITVSHSSWLTWLARCLPEFETPEKIQVHLALDTGMGRLGILNTDSALAEFDAFKAWPQFELVGAFTHFANADMPDARSRMLTEQQYANFLAIKESISAHYPNLLWHYSNSALATWWPEYAQKSDIIRLGISLYGLSARSISSKVDQKDLPMPLTPALSWETQIADLHLQKNAYISYGSTYQCDGQEHIATLPIGYADGLPRNASGYQVLVHGHLCPIVGRICMDMCMIRLPELADHNFTLGETVTLIGTNHGQSLGASDLASHCGTINYEITTQIMPRVCRQYIALNDAYTN